MSQDEWDNDCDIEPRDDCETCKGDGHVWGESCLDCNGTGKWCP